MKGASNRDLQLRGSNKQCQMKNCAWGNLSKSTCSDVLPDQLLMAIEDATVRKKSPFTQPNIQDRFIS